MSDNIIGTVMIRAGKDCHPPQVVYVRGKSKALTGAYTLNVLNESRNALAYRNDLTEFDLQDFEIEKACWDITESEKRLDRQHLRLQELTATPPKEKPGSSLSSACHVAMPKELTAENGAKALMTGEFYETIEVGNDAFCGCGTCDFCIECPDEPESTLQKIPISWANIKEIYAMAVKHFGAVHTPTEEPTS